MALGNKKNIIVGAAVIAIGPSGKLKPAPADLTRARLRDATAQEGIAQTFGTGTAITDWRNIGFTQDGLEVSNDPSWGEVEVDQLLDSALIFKDGMGLSISTTFAEATLENLLVAWGQASSTLTSTAGSKVYEIEGGGLGDSPVERGLLAVGNAPRLTAGGAYGERLYHAYRVLSVESTSTSMARSDASTIPVTFRALPEDDGKYGIIRDTI